MNFRKMTVILMPVIVFAAACLSAEVAFAQQMPVAQPGTLNYFEETVLLNGRAITSDSGQFFRLKTGDLIETDANGRVEALLSPGMFLRVAGNSQVRVMAVKFNDMRFEIVRGSVILECVEFFKLGKIALTAKGTEVALAKKGLYRVDYEPVRLRVAEGSAAVTMGRITVKVKGGRELALSGASNVAAKFDKKIRDDFGHWSAQRDEYLAFVSQASARALLSAGAEIMPAYAWYFNPYYGMFTYMPWERGVSGPYGYRFWSPYDMSYRAAPPLPQPDPNRNAGPRDRSNPHRNADTPGAQPPQKRDSNSGDRDRPHRGADTPGAPPASGRTADNSGSAPSPREQHNRDNGRNDQRRNPEQKKQ
jgi:hypothetical protein